MTTLSVRQTVALVALFVVTSLTFIQLDNRRALDPVKDGLQAVVLPVAGAVGGLVPDGGDDSAAERRLTQMTAERDALQARVAELEVVAARVEQLEAQLNVQEANPELRLLSARVIGRDPTNLQKIITIDKGSADGVRVGMAVVDPNFFVGQVTEVGEHFARVTLVIDTSYSVAARLQGSGADGIVYGRWQEGGRLELRHVARTVEVSEGQLVLTSDSAELRTQGVPSARIIGKVMGEPKRSDQDDTLTVDVMPAVDFESLQVVSVILADAAEPA